MNAPCPRCGHNVFTYPSGGPAAHTIKGIFCAEGAPDGVVTRVPTEAELEAQRERGHREALRFVGLI